MSADASNLLVLFQRPLQPSFFPKDGGSTLVNLPDKSYSDRYKPIAQSVISRFGEETTKTIDVIDVPAKDIKFAEVLDRTGSFSLFIPLHQKIAGRLITLFLDQPDTKTLFAVAAYCRDRLNPYLFQYAFAVAVAHREDTKHLDLPAVINQIPDQFVDPSIFPRLDEEGKLDATERQRIDIPKNYTATDREDEQRMAYFREDIGVNMHHWHWHLVYPGEGPDIIVKKDRRGELFYYMHNQIIARYNTDRFSNKLAKVKFLNNLREPIPEAYFPKMIRSSNQRAYPPRPTGALLRDMNREEGVYEVADLERWRDRILEAIDAGFVMDKQQNRILLTEENGIDILGAIMEASTQSVNPKYYGNLHNIGHNLISFIHDPDGRFKEDYCVMGDVTTAMRDPIFYRWHGYIDSIWAKYKATLPEYTAQQLGYDGVTVRSVDVTISRANTKANNLITFWQKSEVDLNTGLDFGTGKVFASFTHLQHAPFNYNIIVNNAGAKRQGTCRIFLAPKKDERGVDLSFKDQRLYVIEMDKFVVTLNQGENKIVRRSDQSSVTIPYNRTFRQVGETNIPTSEAGKTEFRFCGCGWPQHMLLPKGAPEGMQFDVFVMISNYADDLVDQAYDETINCNDAVSFCGLRDRKYPDKRKMGYPFDRVYTAPTLADFTSKNTNMKNGVVTIKFVDTIIDKF